MQSDKTGDNTVPQRLTTVQAARVLNVSEQRVRQLHERGELADVLVTPLGRLYNAEEVDFLRQQREAEAARV